MRESLFVEAQKVREIIYHFHIVANRYFFHTIEKQETRRQLVTKVCEEILYGSVQVPPSNRGTHVANAAANVARKHFRNRPNDFQILLAAQNAIETHFEESKPTQDIDFSESVKLLTQQILNLPDTHRRIFVKKRLEYFALEDIASELQLPLHLAQQFLDEALDLLRISLND